MKLSEAWLREWVNPPLTTEQLAEQLTMAGLEIDTLSPVTSESTITPDGLIDTADPHHYLNQADVIFDISVTPNRADCLSIAGIARELSALNQLPLHEPNMTPAEVAIPDSLPITVHAPEAAPRYLLRIIKSIDATTTTPHWMQEKLQRCGVRCSGSVVVDITNYVLLELGQPLHAFDLTTIEGGVAVRLATAGEDLTLLNGQTVTLHNDTLIIADQKKPLALAGIMGGLHSAVQQQTVEILLESAYFNPLAIAGRARRYHLSSEAAHRFERGTDATLPYRAMERATTLLLKLCGGVAGPVMDRTTVAQLPQPSTIMLRRQKFEKIIGDHFFQDPVAAPRIAKTLQAIGCQVNKIQQGWQVLPPTWRIDLSIEEDLIEEVARLEGYQQIPISRPYGQLVAQGHPESLLPLKRVRDFMVDRGYQEAITYSFVDPNIQQRLHPDQTALLLPHPLSIKLSAMRLSLWCGLLHALSYNQKRQQQQVRLFETGLRFIPDGHAEHGIRQEQILAGVISGNRHEEQWAQPCEKVDFFDLKGEVEALFELTGYSGSLLFKNSSHPALHPGQRATLYLHDELIGHIGALHPTVTHQLELNGNTLLFEVLLDKLLLSRYVPRAVEISRFPTNRRDIAIVVAEEVAAGDVLALCKQVANDMLAGITLFDLYRGSHIPTGCKSLAIGLWLRSSSHTLEESEITMVVSRIVTALEQRFQASLRE